MRSIKIVFENGAGRLVWGSSVSGIANLVQKVAVDILSSGDSDKYTNKGTELEKDMFASNSFDLQGIQHACNFAAIECLKNQRGGQGAYTSDEDRIRSVACVVVRVDSAQRAVLGITAENLAGQRSRALV